MEEELKDVVQEANALAPNWGATIFQSANEMAANSMIRKKMDEVQVQAKADREWWDRKRKETQEEFMRELDEGSTVTKGDKTSTVPAALGNLVSRPSTAGTSDEDSVLVESGGPTTGGVKGPSKKKKAKK